ncbi:hypothetical protein [Pseudomonas psychrophila]|uniref:hypothetical protein n=1 Tax=Pseudomonas psychrophila TaxID=122355 RepID=UPI000357C984|nr:hypothetical protein [Pseudomonas psychrophila]EPJ91034.1 hypothetical protein CF149_23651 [Pseudomonas psychrophila]
MNNMNHYYYFAFKDSGDGAIIERNTSATLGLVDQKVTRKYIQQAKKVAGATPDAFMSCCTYLGKMTAAEYHEGFE